MKAVNRELNRLRIKLKVTGRKIKYLLLRNGESLEDEERKELEKIVKEHPLLQIAYEIKEMLRDIYEKRQTVKGGTREIQKWLRGASVIYRESASMIKAHLEGVCNDFAHRTTNGVAVRINTKIKLIKRQGYGFSNFENFRLRLFAAFDD
jgi:transposase